MVIAIYFHGDGPDAGVAQTTMTLLTAYSSLASFLMLSGSSERVMVVVGEKKLIRWPRCRGGPDPNDLRLNLGLHRENPTVRSGQQQPINRLCNHTGEKVKNSNYRRRSKPASNVIWERSARTYTRE